MDLFGDSPVEVFNVRLNWAWAIWSRGRFPACDTRVGTRSPLRFLQTQTILQLAWRSLGCIWHRLPSPDLTLSRVSGLFWDQSHHHGLVLADPDSHLQAALLTVLRLGGKAPDSCQAPLLQGALGPCCFPTVWAQPSPAPVQHHSCQDYNETLL